MKLLNKKEGFTLIELMIVVVIIGILAAIAIPQFLRYQLKSKTSEAPRNLGAIRTNEEAFAAKYGVFGLAAANPTAIPGGKKAVFSTATTSGFSTIGFSPSGTVFYSYAVAAAAPSSTAIATATDATFDASGEPAGGTAGASTTIYIQACGDVDANSALGCFYQTNIDTKITSVPPLAGETIF